MDNVNVALDRQTWQEVKALSKAMGITMQKTLKMLVKNGKKNLLEYYVSKIEQKKAEILNIFSS